MDALLLTVSEAAGLLGISRSKAYELIAAEELHSVRIGTCRRVPRQVLVHYIERLCAEHDADAGDSATGHQS